MAGHVAYMEAKRNAQRVLMEETCRKETTWKTQLYMLDNFKMNLKQNGRVWLDSSLLQQKQLPSCCKCSNESLGSVKCGEFINQLRNCQLFKKDSVPRNQFLGSQLIGYYVMAVALHVTALSCHEYLCSHCPYMLVWPCLQEGLILHGT